MKSYKAILYDIDGTLLNTLNMNMYPLIQIIKEELNEDWTFEEVLRFVPYPGMKVLEELGIQNREEVYERWVRYVNEYEERAILYDGFEEVLESFKRAGMIQAIVTSKTEKLYQEDVVSQGIDAYMDTAALANDTKKHKPDPEPLLECLRRLDLSPEDAIYIGDSLSDYQAARNASMDFGYAVWGSVCGDGIDNPDYIFREPKELLTLLS